MSSEVNPDSLSEIGFLTCTNLQRMKTASVTSTNYGSLWTQHWSPECWWDIWFC